MLNSVLSSSFEPVARLLLDPVPLFCRCVVSQDVISRRTIFTAFLTSDLRLFCFQVEQNRVKLLNDQAVAKSQLQKKLGQFLYLTNLEKVTCDARSAAWVSSNIK